jgi:hypothetical protein
MLKKKSSKSAGKNKYITTFQRINVNNQQLDVQFFTNLYDFELNNIIQRPPLASAIQSLETCLLLISLDRFPSALASCAMAIESAWKAATNTGQDYKGDFAKILGEVNIVLPKSAPSFNLTKFRNLRNDVVHFGYSPKDDEASARMLFSTGIPVFFMFLANHKDLTLDLESCLHPDLHDQLQLTLSLNQAHQQKNISAIESSKILRHLIRRMNSNLTIWQESAFDEGNLSQHLEFEAKTALKNMLLRIWHCSETLRCPVCEENDLIIRLEEEQISKGNLHGINAHCINCDLILQAPLLNIFLQKNLNKEQRNKILESYGIRIQK